MTYAEYQAQRRREFFAAIQIPDDGRRTPELTDEELKIFTAGLPELKYRPMPSRGVVIWSRQEAYGDRTVTYFPELRAYCESYYSIGD